MKSKRKVYVLDRKNLQALYSLSADLHALHVRVKQIAESAAEFKVGDKIGLPIADVLEEDDNA